MQRFLKQSPLGGPQLRYSNVYRLQDIPENGYKILTSWAVTYKPKASVFKLIFFVLIIPVVVIRPLCATSSKVDRNTCGPHLYFQR